MAIEPIRLLGRVPLGKNEKEFFWCDWVRANEAVSSHSVYLFDDIETDITSSNVAAPTSTLDGSIQYSGLVYGLSVGRDYRLVFRAVFDSGAQLERILEIRGDY